MEEGAARWTTPPPAALARMAELEARRRDGGEPKPCVPCAVEAGYAE